MLPQRIGKYEIIERLGAGAMGVVYKGFDRRLQRSIAIKTLSAELLSNEQQRGRFYREATATARLAHPNIVSIYDLDEEGNVPYIVMEFVDGPTLQALIDSRIPFPTSQILAILSQISSGLDYAHEQGVIHRDVKPSNLILHKNGSIKIVDFGIAQLLGSDLHTRTGIIIGTPAYMSPEQASGSKVDARTDQYSLGVIAYELFTGTNPFKAETLTGVLIKILQHQPDPTILARSECPPPILQMILKTLDKDRDHRFEKLSEFTRLCQKELQEINAGHLLDPTAEAIQLHPPMAQTIYAEPADTAGILFRQGQNHILEERYEEADRCFSQALKLHPTFVEAIRERKRITQLRKDKLRKEFIQPLLDEAAQRSAQMDFDGSNQCYREILELDPEFDEILVAIQENHRKKAEMEKALWLCTQAKEALQQMDFSEAFRYCLEAEHSFPHMELVVACRLEAWNTFLLTVSERLQRFQDRSEILQAVDWLDEQLSMPSMISYICDPNHAMERDQLIDFAYSLSQKWLQERKSATTRRLLQTLQPYFPGHPILDKIDEEMRGARQNLLDQTITHQSKNGQLLEIHSSLRERNLTKALLQTLRLAREYPQDESLKQLLDSIRKQLNQKQSDSADPPGKLDTASIRVSNFPVADVKEDFSDTIAISPHPRTEKKLTIYVEEILSAADLPLLCQENCQRVCSIAEADEPIPILVGAIHKDFSLTLKILRHIYAANPGPSTLAQGTISHAITSLGSHTIGKFAAEMNITPATSARMDLKKMMLLSLLSGNHSSEAARRIQNANWEEAFLCGMFKNLGEVLMVAYYPESYVDFVAHRSHRSLTEKEAALNTFGFTFEALVIKILEAWRFPREFIDCIAEPKIGKRDAHHQHSWLLTHLAQLGHHLTMVAYRPLLLHSTANIGQTYHRFGVPLSLKLEDFSSILQTGIKELQPLFAALQISKDDLQHIQPIEPFGNKED